VGACYEGKISQEISKSRGALLSIVGGAVTETWISGMPCVKELGALAERCQGEGGKMPL